ncbi:MAG: methionine--tRNA ligase [Clostridiales bacterium]|nr:methionine--tRNA ligase [Clostridiales bacterium]
MAEKPTFYITTPIYYPSDNPHIGHAYTTVAADTMTRYKKMRGYDAYFLTGTDEHGQKIQRRAAEAGLDTLTFIDGIISRFKVLWQTLLIDYDDFIRTTEPRHKKVVQDIFTKIYDKGDIYKSEYHGWYCTPCETFFTERQLAEDQTCPDCGRPVERMKEESYFFRMGKYAGRWLKFIEDNPNFIRPESRRNEMVNFVKQGLEDLCVSRTTFDWGIPVPFDTRHVVYVWFDALINYVSALTDAPLGGDISGRYWPATVHLVGKDIIRFHTVIWPIMLMAAELPLPEIVLGHGWVLIGDSKMSKSKGNVIDPIILSQKYSPDAIRYFLMREMGYGLDCNYSEDILALRINTDLANDYGNLLSRVTGMMQKFQGGRVLAPAEPTEFDAELIELARVTPERYGKLMDEMRWGDALAELWKLVNKANKYIDDTAPWALNKAGEKGRLASVLYNIAEVTRLVTVMAAPVMPSVPAKVWAQLGISEKPELHVWDSLAWGGLPAGASVTHGDPLFPRIDLNALDDIPLTALDSMPRTAPPVAPPASVPAVLDLCPEISMEQFLTMDMRVVKVLACEKVPKTDKLLKFELQMGDEVRTIVSGIAAHYQPQELIGKNLIAIANLQPVKIRGIESKGMLLSAVNDENGKLELLEVPSIESGVRVR